MNKSSKKLYNIFRIDVLIMSLGSKMEKLLRQEIGELEQKIHILHDIGRTITSLQSLDDVLVHVVEAAVTICESEAGFIFLQDQETKDLYIRAEKGYNTDKAKTLQVRGSDNLVAQVFNSGKSVRLSTNEIKVATGILARSMLCVPMISRRKKLGALCVINWTSSKEFDLDDEYLLFILASYAAISVENTQLITELQGLATTDSLTGLMNRRAFEKTLHTDLEYCKRYGHQLSLILIDVDDFKVYNDNFGHPAGDECLKAIAHLICSHVRTSDRVARYGGDEFAVIAPMSDLASTNLLAKRIQKAAESTTSPLVYNSYQYGFTLSIGIASFPEDEKETEDLIQVADDALYRAKRRGKNQIGQVE